MRAEDGPALARSLTVLQLRVAARLRTALAAADASLEEWWVLDYVTAHPGRPTSEVAAHALLPAASMTKLVDRLVDTNAVYRKSDSSDRRRCLLFPTVRGLDRHARLRSAVDAEDAAIADLIGSEVLLDLGRAVDDAAGRLAPRGGQPIA
ncbi:MULTISPECIES: MarR family winged helix-turn-helix transcriptional regulator [Pseudonocardia]|uniref:MarR family protein n=2 Tax=Pseudonocardia TaxID=1847 RepID=A0A1Y2MZY3_PSEAH|nr:MULTISPECIES: MarR family transcriptional regulator [Pseudonocardia]OSY40732.1 MarR family protein [Pseudonocardia autotrophica]TDN71961.1 DNA-binding MarR family transcriptional regulator [Pseudonocardia autotrophica]BBG02648.1 hypothetical protein Pdca_38570 [Pseudonocardia autotrophica]GEC24707.1 hypothetical protein PSA01_17360 [Pseudonocardia saturnea]